jgi:hypothetical protein
MDFLFLDSAVERLGEDHLHQPQSQSGIAQMQGVGDDPILLGSPFPLTSKSPFLTVEQHIYHLIRRIRNGRVITRNIGMPLAWLEHLKRQFRTI